MTSGKQVEKKCALPDSGPCYYRKPELGCGNPSVCLHAKKPEAKKDGADFVGQDALLSLARIAKSDGEVLAERTEFKGVADRCALYSSYIIELINLKASIASEINNAKAVMANPDASIDERADAMTVMTVLNRVLGGAHGE